MDPSELVIGNTYSVKIHLPYPFNVVPKEHIFLWNRHMRYEGIDESWKAGKSYIFSDGIDLYDVLRRRNEDDYEVFRSMTNICVSYMRSGRWYIHICDKWQNGNPLFEVSNICY